jgi:hypothetical protein
MDEPKRIPLTDNRKQQEPKKIRLFPDDDPILDDFDKDENHKQNNQTSIQQLESNKTN